MSTFELVPSWEDETIGGSSDGQGVGSAVLLDNARWFTRLRWIVVLVLIITGLAGILVPNAIEHAGFIPPSTWPWVMTGVVMAANLFFCFLTSRLNENTPRRTVEMNIWLQIIVDLLTITVLVHIVGSTETFIAFTYLFHIVLACIFFSRSRSFLVTLLAGALYLTCVAAEMADIWPASSILAGPRHIDPRNYMLSLVFAGSAVMVWFIVWHLVSTLSRILRIRDLELSVANDRLMQADEEKTRQMLNTTHDLKAPFSGMENNIQLLRSRHWDEISPDVRGIIEKIEKRGQILRERIKEILVLGQLRAQARSDDSAASANLHGIFEIVIKNLDEKAKARNISLHVDVPSIEVSGDEKQHGLLFSNLVTNAISYSHENGTVEISAKKEPDAIHVLICDHGIGIKDEDLPRIFDDYYRSSKAAEFNRESTGLGLAIVRELARTLRLLKIRVTSEENHGTTFDVLVPGAS